MKDGGGRTIRPCDKDQSVKTSSIYESCSGASRGGYGGKIEADIVVIVAESCVVKCGSPSGYIYTQQHNENDKWLVELQQKEEKRKKEIYPQV